MQSVGIDLDGEILNISILNKKKEFNNKSFNIKDINFSCDVNPLYIPSKSFITSGLEMHDILIKNIPLEIKKRFAISKAIKFQNEFITIIDPEKSINIPLMLKDQSILKFFVTTKELLKKHLCLLNNLNIDPDYVSCPGLALCRWASYFFHIKNAFLVHIGQNSTSCVLMKNNYPEKIFSIKIGYKNLINDNSHLSSIDVLTLKHTSKLFESLNDLKKEITKTFVFFTNNSEEKYPVLLTGNVTEFQNLDKFLGNEKTTTFLSSENLETNSNIRKYAISIGLALNIFAKDSMVQFRSKEFTSNKTLIDYGKTTFYFSIIFIILLGIFYSNFSFVLKNKEKKIYKNLIELEKLEQNEFNDNDFIISRNFYEDFDNYEKKLIKETKEFPYFLKAPNVTKTLSWLNNHKFLKEAEILSCNYELQKYPNINEKKEPYLVKVELEFKTTAPSIARSFYDSLMKGEGLVDPKEEITWEVLNDHYKTSFYLKNLIIEN